MRRDSPAVRNEIAAMRCVFPAMRRENLPMRREFPVMCLTFLSMYAYIDKSYSNNVKKLFKQ
jgi:hypothetical protein